MSWHWQVDQWRKRIQLRKDPPGSLGRQEWKTTGPSRYRQLIFAYQDDRDDQIRQARGLVPPRVSEFRT